MKAELIQHNNDDLSVSNIARTSFDKWNEQLEVEKDTKLINYLATHLHISPSFHQRFTFKVSSHAWEKFLASCEEPELLMRCVWKLDTSKQEYFVRHSFFGWVRMLSSGLVNNTLMTEVYQTFALKMPISAKAYGVPVGLFTPYDHSVELDDKRFVDASIRLTMPILVARQMFTHRMFDTNEISRRYVDSEPEVFIFEEYRARPNGSIKQGSGNVFTGNEAHSVSYATRFANNIALRTYSTLIKLGVAPEIARAVLPQSMMTQVIFTGSLDAWAKIYKLRTDSHAQKEVQDLLHMVDEQLSVVYGKGWRL